MHFPTRKINQGSKQLYRVRIFIHLHDRKIQAFSQFSLKNRQSRPSVENLQTAIDFIENEQKSPIVCPPQYDTCFILT